METLKVESRIKWKALLALFFIITATLMNWLWVWGILFLIWAAIDLISGETHLMERVTRAENPKVYGLIVVTWIILSIFSLMPAAWLVS